MNAQKNTGRQKSLIIGSIAIITIGLGAVIAKGETLLLGQLALPTSEKAAVSLDESRLDAAFVLNQLDLLDADLQLVSFLSLEEQHMDVDADSTELDLNELGFLNTGLDLSLGLDPGFRFNELLLDNHLDFTNLESDLNVLLLDEQLGELTLAANQALEGLGLGLLGKVVNTPRFLFDLEGAELWSTNS